MKNQLLQTMAGTKKCVDELVGRRGRACTECIALAVAIYRCERRELLRLQCIRFQKLSKMSIGLLTYSERQPMRPQLLRLLSDMLEVPLEL